MNSTKLLELAKSVAHFEMPYSLGEHRKLGAAVTTEDVGKEITFFRFRNEWKMSAI